jgi:hypothetical protein
VWSVGWGGGERGGCGLAGARGCGGASPSHSLFAFRQRRGFPPSSRLNGIRGRRRHRPGPAPSTPTRPAPRRPTKRRRRAAASRVPPHAALPPPTKPPSGEHTHLAVVQQRNAAPLLDQDVARVGVGLACVRVCCVVGGEGDGGEAVVGWKERMDGERERRAPSEPRRELAQAGGGHGRAAAAVRAAAHGRAQRDRAEPEPRPLTHARALSPHPPHHPPSLPLPSPSPPLSPGTGPPPGSWPRTPGTRGTG